MTYKQYFAAIHAEPKWHPMKSLKREMRHRLKERCDRLSIPLRRTCAEMNTIPWRIHYPDDTGEYWTEYCILTDAVYSKEAADEFIEQEWLHVCSPYDCTGRVFTCSIHIVELPAGVLIMHSKGVDV